MARSQPVPGPGPGQDTNSGLDLLALLNEEATTECCGGPFIQFLRTRPQLLGSVGRCPGQRPRGQATEKSRLPVMAGERGHVSRLPETISQPLSFSLEIFSVECQLSRPAWPHAVCSVTPWKDASCPPAHAPSGPGLALPMSVPRQMLAGCHWGAVPSEGRGITFCRTTSMGS